MKKFNESKNRKLYDSLDWQEMYNALCERICDGHTIFSEECTLDDGSVTTFRWEDIDCTFWTEKGKEIEVRFLVASSDVNGLEGFEPYTEEMAKIHKQSW